MPDRSQHRLGEELRSGGTDVIETRDCAAPRQARHALCECRRAALELLRRSVPAYCLSKLFVCAKRDPQDLYPPCASRGANTPPASAFLYILRKSSPDCVAKSRLADFIGGRQLLDGHGAIRCLSTKAMMVSGPQAKPVHPSPPKRMEGIIHTHPIPCVCQHACLPAEGY